MVIDGKRLLAVVELKSQAGSFGNNFQQPGRGGRRFGPGPCPWLGYLMLLEDCEESRRVVRVNEPFFPVFPEFNETSYARRYELLGAKLVLERLYNRKGLSPNSEQARSMLLR